MASKGTPATALLRRLEVPFTIHLYDAAPSTPNYGASVAAALGVEPARVFKTLVANVDGQLAVGIVPVTGSLHLKALAAALGGKRASMAEQVVAERATGYVIGGISPFAQRSHLPIVVDSSVMEWPTVFVSGGRRGIQVEVAPGDLIDVAGAATAPIADAT